MHAAAPRITPSNHPDSPEYQRNSSSTLDLPAIVYAPRKKKAPKPVPAPLPFPAPPAPSAPPKTRPDLTGFTMRPLPPDAQRAASPERPPGTRLGLLAVAAFLLLQHHNTPRC